MINWIKTYWIGLTVAILITITVLSLSPLDELPPLPGTDKTHHFIAYAVLMLPTALRKSAYWWMIGVLFIGYSGVIELIQPFVNRYGEWLDLAANTGGVLLGALLGFAVNTITKKTAQLNNQTAR